MQKTIQPHVHATTVVCANCGTTFELRSTGAIFFGVGYNLK